MLNLEVLVSCMHQHDCSIVQRSGITSDVLIINQCDKDEYIHLAGEFGQNIRMISTTERGLSRSRNMALHNAKGSICLICDDDEQLEPEYEEIILNAFEENANADVITFMVNVQGVRKAYLPYKTRVKYFRALKTSSCQIAFRLDSILNHNIQFDVLMGSGTGNGGGEEVKFLFDCLRNGLKIWYVPQCIGSVAQTESHWFHGFTPKYMYNQGWSSRRIMGFFWGYIYIFLFVFRKYNLYKADCSFLQALKEIHLGFFENRLS